MTTTETLDALAHLGFSDIEGRVYSFLLSGPPSTGYRISHAIGKPTANTYKAIAALEARGAVLVDEGESRLCRAVPPSELLSQLERGFRERCRSAANLLSQLHECEPDSRVYQIKSVEQVMERARQMLGEAERIALLDVFPGPMKDLLPDIRMAVDRGVRVAAKVYAPCEIEGASVVYDAGARLAIDGWPGQQVSLVVDANQHLLVLLSPELETVLQAIWSQSLFLSCMHHNHLASEILLTLAVSQGRVPADHGLEISLLNSKPPGMSQLMAHFGTRSTS